MVVPGEVLVLGPGAYQVATELLRFGQPIAQVSYLPPLHVRNKYFAADLQLNVDEGLLPAEVEAGEPGASSPWSCTHSAALEKFQESTWSRLTKWCRNSQDEGSLKPAPRGGIIVINGSSHHHLHHQRTPSAWTSSTLGPLAAPFYLLPNNADLVFRVMLVCVHRNPVDGSWDMPQAVHDAWVEQCAVNQFELVFHDMMTLPMMMQPNIDDRSADDDEVPSSFEVIPSGVETRGILNEEELSGSARVLQLIHTAPWVRPGDILGDSRTTRTGNADNQQRRMLVIGNREAAAMQLLTQIGCWMHPSSSSSSSSSATTTTSPSHTTRLPRLLWLHRYGHVDVEVQFLPAQLFCDSMRDLLPQWLPRSVPYVILFVDDDDRHGTSGSTTTSTAATDAARIPITVADVVLQHYQRRSTQNDGRQSTDKHSEEERSTAVWWVRHRNVLHAADRQRLMNLGVEVIASSQASPPPTSSSPSHRRRAMSNHNDDGSENSDDENVDANGRLQHGAARLHEVLSCATIDASRPLPQGDTCSNSILCIPLSAEAAMTAVATMSTRDLWQPQQPSFGSSEKAATVVDVRSSGGGGGITRAITTKYYEAEVTLYFAGVGWDWDNDVNKARRTTTSSEEVGREADEQHRERDRWAAVLNAFHVVLFIGDDRVIRTERPSTTTTVGSGLTALQKQCETFQSRWAPVLEKSCFAPSGEVLGAGQGLSANVTGGSERCAAVWVYASPSSLNDDNVVNDDASNRKGCGEDELLSVLQESFPIEVIITPATSAPASPSLSLVEETSAEGSSVPLGGLARVREMLESTQWPTVALNPQRRKNENIKNGEACTTSSDASAKARHPDQTEVEEDDECPRPGLTTNATLHSKDIDNVSQQPGDNCSIDDKTTFFTCEPPHWMLIDPRTLRTVEVECIKHPTSNHRKNDGGNGDGGGAVASDELLVWMMHMKEHGHKLSRSDRQRQALILAEALGDQTGAME